MRDYTAVIPANTSWPIDFDGDYVQVLSCSSADVSMESDDRHIKLNSLASGRWVEGKPYKRLLLSNDGATVATVVLVLSKGGRFGVPAVTGNVNVSATHSYGASTVGVAGATVGGVLSGQFRITVRAASTNTVAVTLGTVVGTGIPLAAGESYTCITSAGLSMIASVDCTVYTHAEAI